MSVSMTKLVVLGLGLIPSAVAQTTNATLVGDVVDSSSSVVPNATVTVTSKGTGIKRSVDTNESGSYRVFPLNPGTYDVSVSKAGFRTQTLQDVIVEVAGNVKLDFRLDVGQIAETVNVTAAAPMLQTQDASVGGVITTQERNAYP